MPQPTSSPGRMVSDQVRMPLMQILQQATDAHTTMDTSMSSVEKLARQLAMAVSSHNTNITALWQGVMLPASNQQIIAKLQNLQSAFDVQFRQLQSRMQQEIKNYATQSNVLKTRHDTVKNSIGNIR